MNIKRPIYEDEEDKKNEEEWRRLIEEACSCTLQHLTMKYRFDFVVLRNGRAVAFAEVKNRTNSKNKYSTYMISSLKIERGMSFSEKFGLPFYLFVKWTDAYGYVLIKKEIIESLQMQQSNFRGDEQDIEPCVHIRIGDFTFFNPEDLKKRLIEF